MAEFYDDDMVNCNSQTDGIDLPGFYRDSQTGRYFAIPVNPSTQVPNFLDEAKKKAREESSFNKTPIKIRLGRGPKRKACNGLPGILCVRQNGLLNPETFTPQIIQAKLRQLEQSTEKNLYPTLRDQLFQEFNITFLPSEPISCKYVMSFNSCYVGAWSIVHRTIVNSVKKICKQRTNESVTPHVVTGFNQHYITQLRRDSIIHMCPVHLNEKDYALICANASSPARYNCCRLLPINEENNINNVPYHELEISHTIRCGTWNSKQKMIAIGTEGHLYLNKLNTSNSVYHYYPNFPFKNHKAVELSESGEIVYTVSPNGKLMSGDLRTDKITKIAKIGRGVEYMKFMGNDHTLITSGYDDKLSSVDIRMNGVVFQYPGFNNKHRKIPFTFDEDWNVLCSPGQDNVTRFWDLRQGEALASIDPPLKSVDQVHSILTIEENILSTSIFIGDKMFCYEPL